MVSYYNECMITSAQKNTFKQVLGSSPHTLQQICNHMAVLSQLIHQQPKYKSLLPFHETYQLMLKKISEAASENPHFFTNWQELEQLEIRAAIQYRDALSQYLLENKKPMPWQTYFRYCEQPHGIPFTQLLLGLNAHLHANVSLALKQTKNEEQDFFRINDMLRIELPAAMRYLAFAGHDFFAMESIFLKQFLTEEFPETLIKWRTHAWQFYNQNLDEHVICHHAETLAHKLIHICDHNITPRGIREVTKNIKHLEETV